MVMLTVIYQTRCGTFLHHHILQKDVQAGMSSFGKKSSKKVKTQKALNVGIKQSSFTTRWTKENKTTVFTECNVT